MAPQNQQLISSSCQCKHTKILTCPLKETKVSQPTTLVNHFLCLALALNIQGLANHSEHDLLVRTLKLYLSRVLSFNMLWKCETELSQSDLCLIRTLLQISRAVLCLSLSFGQQWRQRRKYWPHLLSRDVSGSYVQIASLRKKGNKSRFK